MLDPFADAQAWYDRAQEHIAEYRRLIDGEPSIWALHAGQRENGNFIYSLWFNRDGLVSLKIATCEVANALFQSLDNIVGAAARAAGVERKMRTSWPWAIEPDPVHEHMVRPAIEDDLNKLRNKGLPEQWLTLINETFHIPAAGLPHIDVVKEISNSGKHWELVPTEANALALMWKPPGSEECVPLDIPADHFANNDEFVFHEGAEADLGDIQLVTRIELVAATKAFKPEPIAAFEMTSRFVEAALKKARHLWSEPQN